MTPGNATLIQDGSCVFMRPDYTFICAPAAMKQPEWEVVTKVFRDYDDIAVITDFADRVNDAIEQYHKNLSNPERSWAYMMAIANYLYGNGAIWEKVKTWLVGKAKMRNAVDAMRELPDSIQLGAEQMNALQATWEKDRGGSI